MIGVCPRCGTLHETTTEDAYSPMELDRMCVKCYRRALDEAAAVCAEALGDSARAAIIRADAPRHWAEVDTCDAIRSRLLAAAPAVRNEGLPEIEIYDDYRE